MTATGPGSAGDDDSDGSRAALLQPEVTSVLTSDLVVFWPATAGAKEWIRTRSVETVGGRPGERLYKHSPSASSSEAVTFKDM